MRTNASYEDEIRVLKERIEKQASTISNWKANPRIVEFMENLQEELREARDTISDLQTEIAKMLIEQDDR